jgi:aminoglycoside/choline kinase family phosphotransferase
MNTRSNSQSSIVWAHPERQTEFQSWLEPLISQYRLEPASLALASSDASFRRYLRIQSQDGGASYIIMDAPPAHEDVSPFVRVAALMLKAQLHGPHIYEKDEQRGFLLLNDLGNDLYLGALTHAQPDQADALMRDAIRALVQWQVGVDAQTLPIYDEALLRRELDLFPQWCVKAEFGVEWNAAQQAVWDRVSQRLIDSALAQPRVAVHRDWMPRNLMISTPNPAILDFQDAAYGPITYDIASLLRDAFISWDEEREIDWAVRYWEQARQAGLPVHEDFGAFWQALEWMGLQRHLKVLGIFCRLKHRDGKPRYASDLPRFFAYATKVVLRYHELGSLLALIEPLSGLKTENGYTLR